MYSRYVEQFFQHILATQGIKLYRYSYIKVFVTMEGRDLKHFSDVHNYVVWFRVYI